MKIIIAHPGTQHSMKLASAIKANGHSIIYVTTVYNKIGSLTNLVSKLLSKKEKKRAQARKNDELNSDEVIQKCELLGLILLVINRLDHRKKIYTLFKRFLAKRFGIKVAKMAIKEDVDVVITFDIYAYDLFKYLNKYSQGTKKVIDYSAAHASQSKEVYLKMIQRYPQAEDCLKAERSVLWDEKYFNKLIEETAMADKLICASNYVKQTIISNGIEKNDISIIPYGCSVEKQFIKKKRKGCLKVLYVGGITIMKGIPILLDALDMIKDENIQVTLVGTPSYYLLNRIYSDKRIMMTGFIPHDELILYYKQADVFVFPSISDGFGLAPLEAMSFGLPCIISDAAGISDLITDKNGIVVDVFSANDLKEAILWCVNNSSSLIEMGKEAYETAKRYSTKRYITSVGEFLDKL